MGISLVTVRYRRSGETRWPSVTLNTERNATASVRPAE